jgi:hypothetical protein
MTSQVNGKANFRVRDEEKLGFIADVFPVLVMLGLVFLLLLRFFCTMGGTWVLSVMTGTGLFFHLSYLVLLNVVVVVVVIVAWSCLEFLIESRFLS